MSAHHVGCVWVAVHVTMNEDHFIECFRHQLGQAARGHTQTLQTDTAHSVVKVVAWIAVVSYVRLYCQHTDAEQVKRYNPNQLLCCRLCWRGCAVLGVCIRRNLPVLVLTNEQPVTDESL